VQLLGKLVDGGEGENADEKDTVLEKAEEANSQAEPADESFANTVERIRHELTEQEKTLQIEHTELDEAIDNLSSRSVAHSEALILCEAQGRSGGRMLIHNPLRESVKVSFSSYFTANNITGMTPEQIVNFEPSLVSLDPDQSTAVRISVDLSSVDSNTVREIKVRIEAMAGENCLSVCWLDIKVVD